MYEEKIVSYLAICCIAIGLLSGCGQEAVTDKTAGSKSETPGETPETADKEGKGLPLIHDKSAFEIKDGVLVKYLGGFETEADVVLPPEVRKIGNGAFALSKKEKKRAPGQLATLHLSIPENVALEKGALYGVMADAVPDSVLSIGDEAFGEWGFLPNDLPEGVQTLGSHFVDLTNGKIKIPSSVKKIAPDAVQWPENAETCGYDVSEDNPYFMSDSNGWFFTTLFLLYRKDRLSRSKNQQS